MTVFLEFLFFLNLHEVSTLKPFDGLIKPPKIEIRIFVPMESLFIS